MTSYAQKLEDHRWKQRRAEILARDGHACRACGSKSRTLQVHHKAYIGEPWEAPDWALETLCRKHHKQRPVVEAFAVHEFTEMIRMMDMETLVKWVDMLKVMKNVGMTEAPKSRTYHLMAMAMDELLQIKSAA
jgi:hypothetical protein